MHRLRVWLDEPTGLYHWNVCHLDGGDYWKIGGSRVPVSLPSALEVGRTELAVWSQDAEPFDAPRPVWPKEQA